MTAKIPARMPRGWILLACIGLIALNMRGPFVAVAPVVGPMQQDLGFSPVELGLLTGIPVLCFSLAAPLASLAARKFGAEVRHHADPAGSAGRRHGPLRGQRRPGDGRNGHHRAAITIGNIAVPLIIRRDFSPRRQGTAMGIYTAALNIGSFLTSVVTAPLAELAGGGMRWLPAGSSRWPRWCSGFWRWDARLCSVRRVDSMPGCRRRPASALDHCGADCWLRGAGLLLLRGNGWLPSSSRRAWDGAVRGRRRVLPLPDPRHRGRPWGAARGQVRQYDGGGGHLGPAVDDRAPGLLLAPELWWLWSSVGGIAQGGGITLIFIAIIRLARDQASAGRMSAVVQGVGYCGSAPLPRPSWATSTGFPAPGRSRCC